jgi:uncharacterized protein YbjT (DUF2867 family)
VNTILVIGAAGRVGSELVKLLVRKGERVRAATRDPAHHGFPRSAAPLIDEAKKRGVGLIVNLTAMGVEQDDSFMLRILERYVESSEIPFVHLRPNWFIQNFDSGPLYADIWATRAIDLPAADARLSFIDVRDIAAAACTALTDNRYEDDGYTLAGEKHLVTLTSRRSCPLRRADPSLTSPSVTKLPGGPGGPRLPDRPYRKAGRLLRESAEGFMRLRVGRPGTHSGPATHPVGSVR